MFLLYVLLVLCCVFIAMVMYFCCVVAGREDELINNEFEHINTMNLIITKEVKDEQ